MDVAEWINVPRPSVAQTRASRDYWSPVAVGVIGTLVLHAAIIQWLVIGHRAINLHLAETFVATASVNAENPQTTELLVFMDLPKINGANNAVVEALASTRISTKAPITPSLLDLSLPAELEVLPLVDDDSAEASADGRDGAETARLFGIYTGQIQARIERIWRRPRTSVNEIEDRALLVNTSESFQCEAQIVQDERGNVQEVLLPRCNGTQTWQHSLVSAIQQASPLPAPPSATSFTHSITLAFLGLPYAADSSEDEYEIVPIEAETTLHSSRRIQNIKDASQTNSTALSPADSNTNPDQVAD